MSYLYLLLALSSTASFASDALVTKRFANVQIDGISNAKIYRSVIEKDGSRAAIRVSVDLSVEGNLGSCDFRDFASSLDYRWYEESKPTYLSVVTTACPHPKPLVLVRPGHFEVSMPRTITTTFLGTSARHAAKIQI